MLKIQGLLALFSIIFFMNSKIIGDELEFTTPHHVGVSDKKLSKISPVVNKLIKDKKLAGASVMVARAGKVCFHEVYGYMDIENNKLMKKETLFRIYSMTKAITTSAVMQLAESGSIKVNDPIGKYIPELNDLKVYGDIDKKKVDITIAQLMTHTSGLIYRYKGEYGKLLTNSDALNKKNDLKEMSKKMGETPLFFRPGTDWAYGTSTDVLGYLIEKVSGKKLDIYLSENFFTPLGMTDTSFFVPKEKVERFAVNYHSDGKGKLYIKDDPSKSRYLEKPKLLSGGGGLVSTISDYMKFLMMIRNGGSFNGVKFLKPETVDLMTQNQVSEKVGWIKFGKEVRDGIGFGYGFSVCEELSKFDPARKVGDYGWGGAASTHYWVSPVDDLIVITMEQTMPYSFMLETALKPIIYNSIMR